MTTGEPGALEGVKVVEAGLLVQGPQASALLAQLGADVTKVELPGVGDQARWLPISPADRRSAYFMACNRGKRSVALDLRVPAGRDAFLRLVERSDIVITNFKPGTMEAWGLGYEDLAARNPQVILGLGSAFGPVGPDAEREGADLSGQAAGGLVSATGRDGGEPTPVGITIADHIASQNLVAGVLAALIARQRTGRGQRVDVSLLGGQVWAQASEYTYYLSSGTVPPRPNGGNAMIPGLYGIVPTADGWLAIVGVVPSERPTFFSAIGRPELATDPRFSSGLLSEAKKRVLFAVLDEVFSARPTAEWCAVLTAAGQRFAPVRSYAEAAADPQLWANDYLVEGDEPGDASMVGMPITMGSTPARVGGPPPELGQHTEEVLLEIGYTWDDIADLQAAGAI